MLDSIKKGFILFPKALKLFYVVAAVYVALNTLNLLLIPASVDVEMSLGRSLLVITLTVVIILVLTFIWGGVLAHVKELIKTGSVNLGSFVKNGKKYFFRILGLSILVTLISLMFGFITFALPRIMTGPVKLLISIVIFLVGVGVVILLAMSNFALVGSDLGIFGSIRKSIAIGRQNFFRILLLMAIMFLMGLLISISAMLIVGFFAFILRPIAEWITGIFMGIISAGFLMFLTIPFMDFYLKVTGGNTKSE